MIELETKFLPLGEGVKLVNGTEIEGYASVFGACDQGGDIVEAGAYGASLTALAADDRRVKMLWQHDPSQPIGVWDEVREDGKGLYVKGRILGDVERGREAIALLEAGAIDGLSIGYRTKRATKDKDGRRHLAELDLWEVSLVTFPMLTDARVGAKGESLDGAILRDLATALRDARQNLAQS